MELIRQTWLNLKTNKTRSFLTMFGISWGLVCLILMTASGEGMWVAQKEKAKALGQSIMIVWGGLTSKGHQGTRAGRSILLTLEDYTALKAQATHLQRSSPEIRRYLQVRSNLNNGTFGNPPYRTLNQAILHHGGSWSIVIPIVDIPSAMAGPTWWCVAPGP